MIGLRQWEIYFLSFILKIREKRDFASQKGEVISKKIKILHSIGIKSRILECNIVTNLVVYEIHLKNMTIFSFENYILNVGG